MKLPGKLFDDSPGSSRFDLSFANSAFFAIRLDGSGRKDKVFEFMDEGIRASAIDVFAVHGAVFADKDFENFRGIRVIPLFARQRMLGS